MTVDIRGDWNSNYFRIYQPQSPADSVPFGWQLKYEAEGLEFWGAICSLLQFGKKHQQNILIHT